jgi:hypothetical protein
MRWQRCISAEKQPKIEEASGYRNGTSDAPFEALGPLMVPQRGFVKNFALKK